MAHVNLLPWRAERRKQREREFYMQLVVAFVAALLVLFIAVGWMNARIDNQNDRNAYLQTEIKQVDVRIAKIKDLQTVRDHLLARKKIIEQLQADRSQMVHLFDELVKTIPNSSRLTSMHQTGQSMTLNGIAQSNASVAEYMRNIQASPWMGHAELSKTEKAAGSTRMPYTFGLTVALNRPKEDANTQADAAPVDTGSGTTPAANATVSAQPGQAITPATTPAKSVPAASSAVKPMARSAAKGGAK